MTPEEAVTAVTRLAAAYPGTTMPEETILFWADHLAPYTPMATIKAIKVLERHHNRLPSLAEFLGAVCDAQERERDEEAMRGLPSGSLYACGTCKEMNGWVEQADGRVSRCPNCEPTQHSRVVRYEPPDRESVARVKEMMAELERRLATAAPVPAKQPVTVAADRGPAPPVPAPPASTGAPEAGDDEW